MEDHDFRIGDFVTTKGPTLGYGKVVLQIAAIDKDRLGFLSRSNKLDFYPAGFHKKVELFKTIVIVNSKEQVYTYPFFWHYLAANIWTGGDVLRTFEDVLLRGIIQFSPKDTEIVLAPNGRFYSLKTKRFDAYVFNFDKIVSGESKNPVGCVGFGIYDDNSIEEMHFGSFMGFETPLDEAIKDKAQDIKKYKGRILKKVILERIGAPNEVFEL